MSALKEAAAKVIAARNSPDGSWDELKEAIGTLEDLLARGDSDGSVQESALDGGPAFPFVEPPTTCNVAPGMMLRDWFAGKALAGFIANERLIDTAMAECRCRHSEGNERSTPEQVIAQRCYVFADAMLAARKKGGAK